MNCVVGRPFQHQMSKGPIVILLYYYPLSLYVCLLPKWGGGRERRWEKSTQDFYKLLFIFWLIVVFLGILSIIESM